MEDKVGNNIITIITTTITTKHLYPLQVELEIFINHKCGQPDDPRKILKTSF